MEEGTHGHRCCAQELAYDPFFTVRELLRIQAGYFGLGPLNYPWIDELLDILNLSDKAEEILSTLSGGMKRRVLIAQALVHKPRVVVLDEPTAGVDVELRKILWTFTKYLNKNGHTIILTTHYLGNLWDVVDWRDKLFLSQFTFFWGFGFIVHSFWF